MELTLSWNLFIGGFFAIILAYSFIIGKNQTLKIIISTYLAAFTADGIGNVALSAFERYSPLARNMTPELMEKYFLIFKLLLLIGLVVFIVINGDFEVQVEPGSHILVAITSNIVFGVLSAGLLISTIMVFLSGGSFLNAVVGDLQGEQIATLLQESRLARVMVYNYNLWFSVPAIAFIIESIISNRQKA